MNDRKRTLRRFWPLYAAVAAMLALAFGFVSSSTASAAVPTPACHSVPSNVITLPGTPRVPGWNVPTGHAMSSGKDVVVQATGTQPGQADTGATAVLVKLTGFNPTGAGQMVAHCKGTGAPGNSTVAYTKGTENSGPAWVALDAAGQFVITENGASAHALLEIDAESMPVAPAKSGLDGAYYSEAQYDVGDTNGGAVATVACKATTDVAISGAVQTLAVGTNGLHSNVPVSSSFPGRMDWDGPDNVSGTADDNTPFPNRLDGWIFQFGGNSSTTSLGDPKFVTLKTLCVPGADIPVVKTFVESSG